MFTLVEKELETFDDVLIQDLESENRFLNSIITYVINSGGKRLRPALVYLFAKMLNNGQVNREHHLIAQIIELIHTATLIHDDIIDESKRFFGSD